MRASTHIFLSALAGVAQDDNPRADLVRRLQHTVEFVVKAPSHYQHCRAEFIERHEHLLRRLRLRHNAHLVLDRQHLGDPRTKNCLIIGQYQFQH